MGDAPDYSDGTTQPSGEPAKGAPARGRQWQQKRWLRALAWISGSLAVLVLITSSAGYLLYRYYNGRIGHFQVVIPNPRPKPAVAGTTNYLLVGLDLRKGTGNQYLNSAEGLVPDTGLHSDTTILAHLDRDGSTTLVSIPRDLYVKVPPWKDIKGVAHPASHDKFTNVISYGGQSLLWNTVEQLLDIRIDHYVDIDLAGFKQISNAIGGVNVCLKASDFSDTDSNGTKSTNLDDVYSRFHGQPNVNHLQGDLALAFVRQRHGLPGGDLDRIKRQQAFLGAVFRKATASSTLLNPEKLVSLLTSASSAIDTDPKTNLWDLAKLGKRLRGLDAGKLHFETLPTRPLSATDPGAFYKDQLLQLPSVGSVLMSDPGALKTFLAPLKNQPAQPVSSTTAPAHPRSAGSSPDNSPTPTPTPTHTPPPAAPVANAATTGTCADPVF